MRTVTVTFTTKTTTELIIMEDVLKEEYNGNLEKMLEDYVNDLEVWECKDHEVNIIHIGEIKEVK